ncbi:MAG: hypothetical protein VX884_00645 [Pseudomonadota bacterium]|nr:hypothetical protein [Pseudomonadota bacterium]
MVNKPHDVAGISGPEIDLEDGDYEIWEKQIDALLVLLSGGKKLMRVDELRRGIESLGVYAYNELSYYERWIASIAKILVEKNILSQAEIDDRLKELDLRGDPR